jgi:hypothetical protein
VADTVEIWAERGACRGRDPETFFESDVFVDGPMINVQRSSLNHERKIRAKLICSSCRVQTQCLQDAYDTDERFGIRGGLTPGERSELQQGRHVAEFSVGEVCVPSTGRLVRRSQMTRDFVDGATIDDLVVRYSMSRSTVRQYLREALVAGDWLPVTQVA